VFKDPIGVFISEALGDADSRPHPVGRGRVRPRLRQRHAPDGASENLLRALSHLRWASLSAAIFVLISLD
jgi:hypothetical protein